MNTERAVPTTEDFMRQTLQLAPLPSEYALDEMSDDEVKELFLARQADLAYFILKTYADLYTGPEIRLEDIPEEVEPIYTTALGHLIRYTLK